MIYCNNFALVIRKNLPESNKLPNTTFEQKLIVKATNMVRFQE